MKTARKAIADSYLDLIRKHPLKTIANEAEYDAATTVLQTLALRDDLDQGEEEYLDVLEVLITAYDDKHYPMPPDRSTPLARLKAIMESSGTTAAQLQEILGASQSMVSLIVTGKRSLSKKAIAKLSDRFKVDPGYFF